MKHSTLYIHINSVNEDATQQKNEKTTMNSHRKNEKKNKLAKKNGEEEAKEFLQRG